jgi:hypothetical protein
VNLTLQGTFLPLSGVNRPMPSFSASGLREDTDIMVTSYFPTSPESSQRARHTRLQFGLSGLDSGGWPWQETQRTEPGR